MGMRRIEPGVPYRLGILGPYGEREVVLTARLVETKANLRSLPYAITGLSFLIVGLVVAAMRPEQRIARLLTVTYVGGSIGALSQVLATVRDLIGGAALATYLASQHMNVVGFALGFAFYHRFPDGRSKGRGWARMEYVMGAWALTI